LKLLGKKKTEQAWGLLRYTWPWLKASVRSRPSRGESRVDSKKIKKGKSRGDGEGENAT